MIRLEIYKLANMIFYIIVLFSSTNCVNSTEFKRVKLTDLKYLQLFKDKYTISKLSKPVLQLQCIQKYLNCQTYMPNEVRCYNRQYDLSDMINWECHADLDSQVRFHDFKVQCEGYDHDYPFDAYIIEGSCSLQFSLESKAYMNIDYYRKDFYETSRLSNFLTLIIMAIVFLAIYRSCNKNRANQELRREFQNGYGINPENPDINLGNSFPAPPPPYASLGLTGPELKPDNIPAVNVVNSTHANGETTRWSSFLTGNVIGVAPSSTQSQITSAEQQPASPRTASNNLNSIISVSRRSESPPPPYISQGSLTNPTSTINTSR